MVIPATQLIERSGAAESGDEFYLAILRLSYVTLNKFMGYNTAINIYYTKQVYSTFAKLQVLNRIS